MIRVRNKIPCSSFYIDNNNTLKQFQVDPGSDLSSFLKGNPTIDCRIEKIINPKHKAKFLTFLNTCFSGCALSFEIKVQTGKAKDHFFQIILSPVYNGENNYALCTVIDCRYKLNHLNIFDDYSSFTSGQLRTSASQILSMINLMGIRQLASLELEKICHLLNDINIQTNQLDSLIRSLRLLVKKDETYGLSLPTSKLMKEIKDIVILHSETPGNPDYKILKKFFDSKLITSFESPHKALNCIVDIRPDLILLDSDLLNTVGYQFLGELELNAPEIDVILISSISDPESIIRTRLYKNVRQSIDKPLTIKKLQQVFTN